MRIPHLASGGRLRHGAPMAEPINWPRRLGASTTRYMIWPPNLACSSSVRSAQIGGGIRLCPVILPRPYYLNKMMWYQTGMGSVNDKARMIIYDCVWKNTLGMKDVPYPSRLLWEGAIFDLGSFSGTKIEYTVNMGFPGNKIFFIGQHVYMTEYGSSSFHLWGNDGTYPGNYNFIGAYYNVWLSNPNSSLINPDPYPAGATLSMIDGLALSYMTVGDPP